MKKDIPAEPKELMTPEEEQRLEELESIIRKDLKGFIRVGMALKEIKDSRLYRAKYTTWKAYLKAEWDLGRRIADYQIDAYTVVKNIEEKWHHGSTSELKLPQNERQTRPLTLLPPAQQVAAWDQIVTRTNGNITALQVTKVVEEFLEKSKQRQRRNLQVKATKEVDVPDDFTEAFRAILTVLDKHRAARWKDFKRKKALELVKALETFLAPQS